MSDAALSASAAMGLASTALFATVGVHALRRAATGERRALRAFAIFWLGAAGYVCASRV